MPSRGTGQVPVVGHRNLMRFDKAKCKAFHQGHSDPWYLKRLGEEQIKISRAVDSEVLVDERLDMSQPCVLAAQKVIQILGCSKSSMPSRAREVILTLLL
ncbi:hypothetical protein DUI87_13051 [Hirundo rustica rustica]|uniref:Uncharacterized protein n=1 Tax=Hirundo rustica rustica TaxID=333673 RepID=A0A3M0KAM6_HIRRU|nr:hypothetical protein DUI87_13051 [Hirundo rustica rustica]